jgi:hypothetical protein
MVRHYRGAVLGWCALVGTWLLFAAPADPADALIGAVAAAVSVALVSRAAPSLLPRPLKVTVSIIDLGRALPHDVLAGTWRVMCGRWPGRRRELPIIDRRLAGPGDRALVGLALSLGPSAYLVADEPLTVHQIGRGAGEVAARLSR